LATLFGIVWYGCMKMYEWLLCVEYDVVIVWYTFLYTWIVRNYMKLLICGDVVDIDVNVDNRHDYVLVLIIGCLLLIMMMLVELLWWRCWWIIYVYVHICYWWCLDGVSMYWNMLMLMWWWILIELWIVDCVDVNIW